MSAEPEEDFIEQIREGDANGWGVERLRLELKKRGLSQCGKKAQLLERLVTGKPKKAGGRKKRSDNPLKGLPEGAYWELLDPRLLAVPEPVNVDAALKPPTALEGPANPKFGYDLEFERAPFLGTDAKLVQPVGKKKVAMKKKKRSSTNLLSEPRHNTAQPIPQPRIVGGPNIDHIKRYKLNLQSAPVDWFKSIMPLTPSDNKEDLADIDAIGDGTLFCVSNWRGYTNFKAEIAGAGYEGREYASKWILFSDHDLFQMLGLITLDGVAPHQTMERRMKPQSVERTSGNDRLAQCLGPNPVLKWKLFRRFFGVQDPTTAPPKREKCPNYKNHSLFKWCRYMWRGAWVVSKVFSADEQTCPMRGRCIYITRCGKYKRIGDGLQADCLADGGYTFDFYFRNEPVDECWLEMGLAPLHCRLMHMFSRLEDDGHECNMDNLYNSVSFARAAYSLEVPQDRGEPRQKRVKTQGVVRAFGRGVPAEVKQDGKTKKEIETARGTTKVAVLRNDPMSKDLIIGSCVDQKVFYMLSMTAEKVDWVEKQKEIFSHAKKKVIDHSFLRWSISDDYNQEMNDNDIADQLRLIYRCLRFQRNTKWWWAEFLYVWEVSIVNSYLLMKRYYEAKGLKPRWTHWEFQENIAWALIDPVNCWPTKDQDKSTSKMARPNRSSEMTSGRRPKFTAKSLAEGGALGMRLNQAYEHEIQQLTVEQKKANTTVCQLHRMANKEINGSSAIPHGGRQQVVVCKACGVALCLNCWGKFHGTKCFEKADFREILDVNN